VLTGPFSGVKEQVVAEYAERLTAAGITTLTFDHRGFGASEGRRGCTDPRALLLAAPPGPALAAVEAALAPAIRLIQDDRELWLLRLRVIMNSPQLLPRLAATAATAEQEMSAAITERLGLEPGHAFPPVLAAVTGAALRVALMRWAADARNDASDVPGKSLSDHVHEAFGMVAAGLADPVPPTP
jgi:fermentation-respiration switch protein FrsA (DUF1100 family)